MDCDKPVTRKRYFCHSSVTYDNPGKRQTNTTMDNKMNKRIAFAAAIGLPVLAIAGTEPAPIEQAPANAGDWCTWYGNKPGIIYSDKENPYLQEFQIEGRLQYQYAHIEGDLPAGGSYKEDFDEVRRARIGVKAKFLQYFGLKYQINVVDDGRPEGNDLDWGYDSIDEAYVSFNLGKALGETGLDELNLIYGRQKFVFGTESHNSSTKLLTIERSALSNKVYGGFRPTGVTLAGEKGPLSVAASLYSSTTDGTDNEEFNGWQDSYSALFNVAYQINDELLVRGDLTYNGAEPVNEDSVMNYEWAIGFGAEYDAGPWGVTGDVIYGDNGDGDFNGNSNRQGNFYGMQVTPWYWLIDKKLQLVGQYQWQGSDESQGVRINSRYGTRNDGTLSLNDGRADSHHSLYGGLNYYICGHSAKIQAGIEYQTWEAPARDFDTLTYLIGFRTFF